MNNKDYKFLTPVEMMPTITRKEVGENFDAILEKIEKENIAFRITDEGKKDLVLCPAAWLDCFFDDDFGCVINSAIRYALGRMTYMPSTVAGFIIKNINVFDTRTMVVAIRDIDDALRDENLVYRETWVNLRNKLEDRLMEIEKRGGND